MRDISEMATVLTNKLEQKLEKLKQAQRDTAKVIWEDTVNEAPLNTGSYISSIKLGDTEVKKDIIKTSVFSDLTVWWQKKSMNIPLACFLEWGTGPLGESTNTFPHGYPYTTDQPWNLATEIQLELTGTWGMSARPHFYPALQKNIALYKDNLRKALREK
jgi:hypothetical protein